MSSSLLQRLLRVLAADPTHQPRLYDYPFARRKTR